MLVLTLIQVVSSVVKRWWRFPGTELHHTLQHHGAHESLQESPPDGVHHYHCVNWDKSAGVKMKGPNYKQQTSSPAGPPWFRDDFIFTPAVANICRLEICRFGPQRLSAMKMTNLKKWTVGITERAFSLYDFKNCFLFGTGWVDSVLSLDLCTLGGTFPTQFPLRGCFHYDNNLDKVSMSIYLVN